MLRRPGYIIILLALLLSFGMRGSAQSGFYVPKSAKIFFSGDSATIFGDVYNSGQFGIGKFATVNFKGIYWNNEWYSSITDETNSGAGISGQGGLVRFLLPDDLLANNISQRQYIIGGYNPVTRFGPMFANLQLNNRWGVSLDQGSAKVRHHLDFKAGHLYTNDNTLIVGDKYPGQITGYNEQRFVVTGNRTSTGVLLREHITKKDGPVSFPVGSTVNGYAPASVYLRSDIPDDFYARVSDTVFSDGITGTNINNKSVNKTWQIGKMLRPGQDDVEITLQHQLDEEGADFRKNRLISYISKHTPSGWDTALFKIAPSTPGVITTGSPIRSAAMNSRTFFSTVGAQSYYTKFTYPFADSVKNNLWVNGFRLNSELVKLVWTTRPEINIKYFVVQRKLANQAGWSNVDSVDSKAINGYSFSYLNYTVNDPNKYTGISYYRIIMVDYQGGFVYSEIIVIDGQSKPSRFAIWPNPSKGRFMISIDKLQRIKSVVIWNAIGQKIRVVDVTDKELVEMFLYTPGTYVIGFVSNNTLIESRKLVITGW